MVFRFWNGALGVFKTMKAIHTTINIMNTDWEGTHIINHDLDIVRN